MSFQLLDIVIYGYNKEKRVLSFHPGRLNIITGDTGTGKTALIGIIDYCLGSDECKIPEGKIRETVQWVGLRLKLMEGQAFIARRLPASHHNSTEDIFYDVKKCIKIPEFKNIEKNINLKTLEELLSKHTGIGENLHLTPEGRTRPSLSANIRHALYFNFQHQTKIMNEKILFHKQEEPFIPQTIKDVLPYFLGAIGEDYVSKLTKLHQLRYKKKQLERKFTEAASIIGSGMSKAQTLIAEAQDIGLYTDDIPDNWEECIEALEQIQRKPQEPEKEISLSGDTFDRLQRERQDLISKLGFIKEQLDGARALVSYREDYSHEAKFQVLRLKSINLFNQDEVDECHCPLCNSKLEDGAIPKISDLSKSLKLIESQVRSVEERSPQMGRALRQIESAKDEILRRLRENREALEAIQRSNKRLQRLRDEAAKRAHMLGRIGLYLESLPQFEDTSDLRSDIKELDALIKEIADSINEESIEGNIDSILSILSQDMTSWARELKLEHSRWPMRLDIKKLTVIFDRDSGPITMDNMGSGENWIYSHLLSHFALHKWFVLERRPVPRFLFLDQPSQVYFPRDKKNLKVEELKDRDRELVAKMYKFINKIENELKPGFQIIVTDHAEFPEKWFQQNVIENWHDGNQLVPESWIGVS